MRAEAELRLAGVTLPLPLFATVRTAGGLVVVARSLLSGERDPAATTLEELRFVHGDSPAGLLEHPALKKLLANCVCKPLVRAYEDTDGELYLLPQAGHEPAAAVAEAQQASIEKVLAGLTPHEDVQTALLQSPRDVWLLAPAGLRPRLLGALYAAGSAARLWHSRIWLCVCRSGAC
jgi:hypothetical protein